MTVMTLRNAHLYLTHFLSCCLRSLLFLPPLLLLLLSLSLFSLATLVQTYTRKFDFTFTFGLTFEWFNLFIISPSSCTGCLDVCRGLAEKAEGNVARRNVEEGKSEGPTAAG